MSRAAHPALSRVRQVAPANPSRPFAGIAGAFHRWQQDRRNRRIVAGLTDTQLEDVGIDRAALLRNRPSMDVKA